MIKSQNGGENMSAFIRIFSLFLSFIVGFFSFPMSFLPCETSEDFRIAKGDCTVDSIIFNGKPLKAETECDVIFNDDGSVSFSENYKINFNGFTLGWFNYFGISYRSDAYIKGTLCYRTGVIEKSEDFFLESCKTDSEFYSFIDNCLDKTKANAVVSIEFHPLDKDNAMFSLFGISVFNRDVPDREIYIENDNYKLGIDLLWGGALSYLEDKNSDVEAVSVDNIIKVDSNASKRYNSESVNSNVNLINRFDAGRLVQQSYYGTTSDSYDPGIFMGNVWSYNPVQGGNQFNDSSKIVDLRVSESSVYIKCRPLDWAKPKEAITPSYMEATYEFKGNTVHASCRFVDCSEKCNTEPRTQEIPAFYCIEPLNNFIYYSGDNPWSGEKLTTIDNLIFWPDAGYPNYVSKENWAGFRGEFEDSFGIGIFVPDETSFLTGVYERGTATSADPSVDSATSYIAVTKDVILKHYEPFGYEFYITTGDSDEIRGNFNEIINF